jgi:hypothetical protein
MKIISSVVLLVIAVATLTACESGKGPSKPAAAALTQIVK